MAYQYRIRLREVSGVLSDMVFCRSLPPHTVPREVHVQQYNRIFWYTEIITRVSTERRDIDQSCTLSQKVGK